MGARSQTPGEGQFIFSLRRLVSRIDTRICTISIIIPTLLEENYIGPMLSRLQAFRAISHEIIVSDGGSSDRTVEIARPLADQVIEHRDGTRQTISQGRNAGARAARGEFVVFMDADCTVENPDQFFSAALAHFVADPKLVGLTAYIRILPSVETLMDKVVLFISNTGTRIRNNRGKGDAVGGEFQMARRAAFESIGGYREDLVTCEDRDLFARLSALGRVLTDPKLTIFHTGRRRRNVGWPRLILLFFVNTISLRLRGKVVSREWTPER